MPIEKTDKIWMDGKLVNWDDATVHVLTHTLHYGSGVFEGIRAYLTARGPAVFRLTDHMRRLHDSAALLHMDLPYSVEELVEATKETMRANRLDSGYIRPIAFLGYGEMGLNPLPCPVNVSIAAWPWGTYLGQEALRHGVRMKISTWRRMDPNINPVAAITPPLSSGALEGITRDSVMTIARDLGYPVCEKTLLRTDLYLADEAFLSGTAAEVVPIREVDDREIGEPGEVTRKIQEAYFAAVHGQVEKYGDWLEYVDG